VALIGGGRWGRQYASVLSQFPDRIERVLWVSRFNRTLTDAFAKGYHGKLPRFEMFSSLEDAIAEQPDAAIVVTATSDHAATAGRLVGSGIPTLVEKPFALGGAQARRLVELAGKNDVPLCAALHLLKADFLDQFRQLCAGRRIAGIRVEWLDPESEERWGEVKSVNLAAYKADEAIPHCWSILDMVVGSEKCRLRAVRPGSLGAADVEVDIGPVRAMLVFGRRAAARKRYVCLEFCDGGSAELDFAIEPGRATVDGIDHALKRVDAQVGPLATQVRDFLDFVTGPRGQSVSYSQLARRCLGSVELMELVRERLVAEEARAAAASLARGCTTRDPDVSAWIIDNVAPIWAAGGLPVERAIQEVADLAIETFEVASGLTTPGARPPLSGDVSPALISAVRGSRFCVAFAEHYASLRGGRRPPLPGVH